MHPDSITNDSVGRARSASRSDAPTLAQTFSAYLSGELPFDRVRAEVMSAHRALVRAGTPRDAILRFMRRSLDTGAARASATDNVYRFNAIHDELVFWIAGVCGTSGADALRAEPMLADAPPPADPLDEIAL